MDKPVEEILAEEIKHLRAILQRKEQALAILEGNNVPANGTKLETNSPVSLNSFFEYPKTAPTKKKVYLILKQRNCLMKKSDIVSLYLLKEGTRDTETNRIEATNEITNALSNLRTVNRIKSYKPETAKMKGGFWGLSEFFGADEKPLEKYIPNLTNIDENE